MVESIVQKGFEVADEDGVSTSPNYRLVHDALQAALDDFAPGVQENLIFSRAEQLKAVKAGATPEAVMHDMKREALQNLLRQYVLPNIDFTSTVEGDAFVLQAFTISMNHETFGKLLSDIETAIVKALDAKVLQ